MNVLVACEYSGVIRDAFAARGHNAWSCDLLPTESPGKHIQGNVLHWLQYAPKQIFVPDGGYSWHGGKNHHDSSTGDYRMIADIDKPWDIGIFCPPCTRLTNSGVRWLHVPPPGKTKDQMWQELEEGAAFYRACRDAKIPKVAVENPTMHKYARERINIGHRQVVQPWWFGDKTFKATGLELIGLPDLVPTDKLIPPKPGTDEHKAWSWVHRASPGANRAKDRARFHPGIAKAMAEQWGVCYET